MPNYKFPNKLLLLAQFFLSMLTAAVADGTEPYLAEKRLVVLITSYNNQDWISQNLKSVFAQKYSNYRVIYIDDCSSDNSAALIQSYSRKFPRNIEFQFIRNQKRVGALENIYYAVHSCKDDEIIVSLDGDDWFRDPTVLQEVNAAYSSPNVWLTHGSLIEYPNNSTVWSIPIPQETIDTCNFRKYRCPSHLRTFYAWLFKQIKHQDLIYDNAFFPMAWDQAMMFPMIEMAGERHLFISKIVYVYNVANALNDNKVNPQLQNYLEACIRAKPPYTRLDKSPLEK